MSIASAIANQRPVEAAPLLRQQAVAELRSWLGIRHSTFDICHSSSRAFTLIELILVMALLAIVLGVSAPALSNFFRGRSIDSTARRFVSLIRYGQSRAVSEGVPMVLWIDSRRGTYGLQQEPGYSDVDTKAVTFELGKDLRMEVADVPVPRPGQSVAAAQALRGDPNVPRLRFQPDGFIGETSPQTVVIRENANDAIWITQTRNRLSYEIHTSSIENAMRYGK